MSSSSTDRRLGPGPRLLAGGIAALCAGVLVTASALAADEAGHGTHEQLGLPPCIWAVTFDAPCVTCGMTTAFTHAAHGELWTSLLTQPLGMILSVGAAAVFWIGLFVAITGSRLGEHAVRLVNARILIILAVLAGAAWAYKLAVWNGA